MSALLFILFAWVGAFRLGEWAFFDHDREDLWVGLLFSGLAAVALVIARSTQ